MPITHRKTIYAQLGACLATDDGTLTDHSACSRLVLWNQHSHGCTQSDCHSEEEEGNTAAKQAYSGNQLTYCAHQPCCQNPKAHMQGVIASEEEDEPVAVEETYSGNYVVVFDPLDGSSNIDAGISTGSIFGVYAPSEECRVDDMDDPVRMMENCLLNTCQPGESTLLIFEHLVHR